MVTLERGKKKGNKKITRRRMLDNSCSRGIITQLICQRDMFLVQQKHEEIRHRMGDRVTITANGQACFSALKSKHFHLLSKKLCRPSQSENWTFLHIWNRLNYKEKHIFWENRFFRVFNKEISWLSLLIIGHVWKSQDPGMQSPQQCNSTVSQDQKRHYTGGVL